MLLPNKKYDIIFSLANDNTIDGRTEFSFIEYVTKIQNLLNRFLKNRMESFLDWVMYLRQQKY